MAEPHLGDIVTGAFGRGVVRFFGSADFKAGKWCGIELPGPTGKNDGSVAGVQYFSCPPNHGIFVRATQVVVVGSEVSHILNSET